MTPKETDPELPVCPGVSSGGVGWCWPAAGMGALCAAVHAWGSFEDYLYYLHHSLAQVNSREATQLHPATED